MSYYCEICGPNNDHGASTQSRPEVDAAALNKATLSFIRRNYWKQRFYKEHLQRSIRRVLSVWNEFTVPHNCTMGMGPVLNPNCIRRELEAVLYQTGSKPYDH